MLPFLSHLDEIAHVDFTQHAVALDHVRTKQSRSTGNYSWSVSRNALHTTCSLGVMIGLQRCTDKRAMQLIFSKILTIDTPHHARGDEMSGVFCEFEIWFKFWFSDYMLCQICYFIEPRYNGAWALTSPLSPRCLGEYTYTSLTRECRKLYIYIYIYKPSSCGAQWPDLANVLVHTLTHRGYSKCMQAWNSWVQREA